MSMVNKKMSLIITGACLFLAVTFAGAQQATQVKRIINTKSVVNKNLVNKQRNDDDIVAHSTVIFLSRHFESFNLGFNKASFHVLALFFPQVPTEWQGVLNAFPRSVDLGLEN